MNRPAPDMFFVSTQFLLFFIYIFRIRAIDFYVSSFWQYAGLTVAVAGLLAVLLAIFILGSNLSPFPTPKQSARLIQSGIYKFIRHPIYTGILFISLGWSVYSQNTLRLIIFLLLGILFFFKARYEEQLLMKSFPDYSDYRKTSGMFLPRLLKNINI